MEKKVHDFPSNQPVGNVCDLHVEGKGPVSLKRFKISEVIKTRKARADNSR